MLCRCKTMSINRIRLEFKVRIWPDRIRCEWVLIESDWNLKPLRMWMMANSNNVLIESDWNLKSHGHENRELNLWVLIESDWNLKMHHYANDNINPLSINRIRLEFKATPDTGRIFCICVLIESDWNLKFS